MKRNDDKPKKVADRKKVPIFFSKGDPAKEFKDVLQEYFSREPADKITEDLTALLSYYMLTPEEANNMELGSLPGTRASELVERFGSLSRLLYKLEYLHEQLKYKE